MRSTEQKLLDKKIENLIYRMNVLIESMNDHTGSGKLTITIKNDDIELTPIDFGYTIYCMRDYFNQVCTEYPIKKYDIKFEENENENKNEYTLTFRWGAYKFILK